MRKRRMTIVALVAALGVTMLAAVGCSPAQAQLAAPDGERRTISVSGSGTVSADPDKMVIRLGVETMAETASEALSQNSQQMQAVIDALKEADLPAADIQTQTVQLRPQYEAPEREPTKAQQREAEAQEPELVGYVASNIVEASSEDLDAVGALLDAAVQAGANRVEGIRFEASDSAELLSQAREAAWEDAAQKAQQLADLAGVELGNVISINESTSVPRPVGLGAAMEKEAAVPIEPGSENIRVSLHVTWALR